MRNLPFLFVCARAPAERAATPTVSTAPVFRNVRRVMGEEVVRFSVVFMGTLDDAPNGGRRKKKETSELHLEIKFKLISERVRYARNLCQIRIRCYKKPLSR